MGKESPLLERSHCQSKFSDLFAWQFRRIQNLIFGRMESYKYSKISGYHSPTKPKSLPEAKRENKLSKVG
jgi:hypothetical protein